MSLHVQDLATGYRQGKITQPLHRNISFETAAGDVILLAGPNGVGKSVFLKTLMGILPAFGGTVHCNHINLHACSASERQTRIALMLATPPQIELMSPLEIVLTASPKTHFFQSFSSGEKEKARLELDFCGVGHLANAIFSHLSDGEKQKIMLARCLFQNTQIVLLDEPTAFLDYPSKIDFWTRIQERATQKGTVFIVCTHDLHIAQNRVNKVWLMNQNEFTIFENPADFQIDFVKG